MSEHAEKWRKQCLDEFNEYYDVCAEELLATVKKQQEAGSA